MLFEEQPMLFLSFRDTENAAAFFFQKNQGHNASQSFLAARYTLIIKPFCDLYSMVSEIRGSKRKVDPVPQNMATIQIGLRLQS